MQVNQRGLLLAFTTCISVNKVSLIPFYSTSQILKLHKFGKSRKVQLHSNLSSASALPKENLDQQGI